MDLTVISDRGFGRVPCRRKQGKDQHFLSAISTPLLSWLLLSELLHSPLVDLDTNDYIECLLTREPYIDISLLLYNISNDQYIPNGLGAHLNGPTDTQP